MKNIFKKRGIAIAVVAVIIALVSVITLTVNPGNSDFLSSVQNTAMRPVKNMMTSLIQSLEKIYGYMYKYDQIVEENEQLKDKVAQLEEEYRDYTAISNENEELKQLLGLTDKHSDFKLAQASIISWTASNWSSTFTISKGTNAGIELNDCVITENGYIIGQVTEIGKTTATITTLIDTSSSIGALVYASGEAAVAEGDYKLFQDGLLKLAYLPDGAQIATGDTIITSGKGGYIPQGLVIGYIEDIYSSGSGLADYASIKPAADIDSLTTVYIITDFDANN